MSNQKNVLGVGLHLLNSDELLKVVENSITQKGKCTFIGYYNAHHAVESWKNLAFRDYLNSLDILHTDGTGMFISSRFLYGSEGLSHKVNGTDFYPLLLRQAEQFQWSVYFLGDTAVTIEKLRATLITEFPTIKCAGFHHGYFQNDNNTLLQSIKDSSPDILFVGLGLTKQMEWIQLNRHVINASVRVCLMVGGGIGYLAKTRKRAPKYLQIIGLEWLYRLFSDPRYYWYRYLIGIPHFVYLIVRQKLKS